MSHPAPIPQPSSPPVNAQAPGVTTSITSVSSAPPSTQQPYTDLPLSAIEEIAAMSSRPTQSQSAPLSQPQPIQPQSPTTSPPADDKQSVIDRLKVEVDALQQKRTTEETAQRQNFPQSQQQAQTQAQRQLAAIQIPGNPPTTPVSSRLKEQKDAQHIGSPSPEHAPIIEKSSEFEAPPEIQPWVEVKPDPVISTLPIPVEDEFGEILLKASAVPKPNIILPMEEEEIQKALHHRIADSIRWLGEWCKRVIKVYPKRTFFKQDDTGQPTQPPIHPPTQSQSQPQSAAAATPTTSTTSTTSSDSTLTPPSQTQVTYAQNQ